MDFEQYVAARQATLGRVAALLGCPEALAPSLVADALTASARRIEREEYPDPEVYRVLTSLIGEHRAAWPPEELPPEDPAGADGLAARRDLAALDDLRRAAVVLLEHGDLTLDETAYALRTTPDAVLTAATAAQQQLGPDTRDRLQAAAETLDLPPPEPMTRPRAPRRWPWVAAAAATAAAVAALGTAAAGPDPDAPRTDTLKADQVPSLFGYDVADARQLMQARGLRVGISPVRACETGGKVVASDPPTGTRFDEGDPIVLHPAAPSDAYCMARYPDRAAAWELIDFATGRGPAPLFADRVFLVVDDSYPAVLSREDAGNPLRWGRRSALARLREASSRVVREDGTYLTARLDAATVVPPPHVCGVRRPAEAGLRAALSISVVVGSEDPPCPLIVDVYRSRAGAIDSVVMYTAKATDEPVS